MKDFIFNKDCLECMLSLPKESVDMVITSPPYNVNIDYKNKVGDSLSLSEYLDFTSDWVSGCYELLKSGGRFALNIGKVFKDSEDNPYHTNEYILPLILSKGFKLKCEIIWMKRPAERQTGGSAWGSWLTAKSPSIRAKYEYLWIFYKDDWTLEDGVSDITVKEFMEYTIDLWVVKDDDYDHPYIDHPVPYPIELVNRLLKLFSYKGSLIFDPFLGSGTTALAAKQLQRHYLGCEINPDYFELAKGRLQQTQLEAFI